MKFTDRWSCAAEAFEERKNEFDNTIKQNPDVQAHYRRVDECLGSIRNALIKGGASDEAIETLDELEESIYTIVSKVIENLAEETHVETYIAYQVGLLYSKLLDEKKASRSKQKDMDQD